jgi:choline-sulfatase
MKLMGVHFKEGGYDTGYFGKWHINVKTSDTKRHGFDEMGVLRGKGADHLIPEPSINFLKKDRSKPFLMVTSFTSPHDICEMCRGQKIPGGPIGEFPTPEKCPPAPVNFQAAKDQTDTMKIMKASYHNTSMTPVGKFTPEKWRQMRWGYYRLIERADREIGKVLKALEDSGKADNTVIVFTADHGDCTGAHGFAQKTVFYDESARIPFIVSFKGKIKNAISKKLINAGVDTLPSLLDYAGLEIPSQLKGRSVKPLIENADTQWRDFIVVSNHMVQGGIPPGLMKTRPTPRGRMIRTARFKYSVYDLGDHRESLIDMEKDPNEMVNLARQPEYRTILEKHRKLLKDFAEENGDKVALEVINGDYKELGLKKKKKK